MPNIITIKQAYVKPIILSIVLGGATSGSQPWSFRRLRLELLAATSANSFVSSNPAVLLRFPGSWAFCSCGPVREPNNRTRYDGDGEEIDNAVEIVVSIYRPGIQSLVGIYTLVEVSNTFVE